jgi:BNR repeat-like domain
MAPLEILMSTLRLAAAIACALLLAACGGGGGGSSGGGTPPPPPPAPDPQFRVSGPTLFAAGCDLVPAVGTLYVNAEVEPMISVNPKNTQNLVGIWQQDRWSNGGARGLLTGVSLDGGMTWTTRMAAFSRCAGGTPANGGDYARASDPWVSFAPDGTVYQSSLSFSGGVLAPGSSSAILVSRSTDGGSTWSNPATVIRDGDQAFNDKDSITADATDARFVYAVWDRLDSDTHGPTYFSRTVDSGQTWETARSIYDPGANRQTINNQVVVLPNGTLVNFFTQLNFLPGMPATAALSLVRSTDKGVAWAAPILLSANLAVGTDDPDTGTPIRDAATLGSFAAGPHGDLVATWQDSRFSNGQRDGIAFSRSQDGGLTWSPVVQINSVTSVQAFLPSVAVRADGTIGVTYYDLRNNTPDPNALPTDIWLTRSTDGVTWRETHVSGPFDLSIAPVDGGLFVGDYEALTSVGMVFVPFYVQTNTGNLANRTDVFATLAASAVADAAKAAEIDATTRAETVIRAQQAPPLAMTPEWQQKLHTSAMRTIKRRLGHEPQATVPAPQSP